MLCFLTYSDNLDGLCIYENRLIVHNQSSDISFHLLVPAALNIHQRASSFPHCTVAVQGIHRVFTAMSFPIRVFLSQAYIRLRRVLLT